MCLPRARDVCRVPIGDDPHLAFYARCNILPGQELTYDYRLKEEDDDNKIECKCGAPTCRGTIN